MSLLIERDLKHLSGVWVSEATVRWHTEQVGQTYVEVQTRQSQGPEPDQAPPVPEKLALRSDGGPMSPCFTNNERGRAATSARGVAPDGLPRPLYSPTC